MRALVLREHGVRPEVEDVPEPVPPADGVVVRVGASGLCRSDWHAYAGHDPDVVVPQVLGHELAGVVEAAGPEVTRWRPGDRVTTPFVCGCGRCATCRGGDPQVCPHQRQPGFTDDGSLAELVALHHADVNLVRLPPVEELGDAAAAALGCRTATAYRAVAQRAALRPGEDVVVLGCGGVGLSAVAVARALGAGTVVAVDVSAAALDRARGLGADVLVTASAAPADEADQAGDDPVVEAVRAATGGGPAVAVEALGSGRTLAQGIASLRRRGRLVQVGLLPPGPRGGGRPRVAVERVISHELDVLGSHGMAASAYPALLGLVASGALVPQALVGEVLPLAAAGRALVDLPTRTAGGVVVVEPWR